MDARAVRVALRGEDATAASGTCEELTMIPDKFQEELDALGRKLQQALGTSGPAVSPAAAVK